MKIDFFRALAVITMATFFLPIFSINLSLVIPFIQNYIAISFVWVIAVLVYHKEIYTTTFLINIIVWFIIFYLGSQTVWTDIKVGENQNVNLIWILDKISSPLTALLMYLYFLKSGDIKGLVIVTKSALIFIFLTSILSIIGTSIYPNIVRDLAANIGGRGSLVIAGLYGVGNYSFFGSLLFLFPIFAYYLKNETIQKKYKVLLMLNIVVLAYALIKSQFSTASLLTIIFFLLSFFSSKKNIKTNIIVIFISLGLFSLLSKEIASILFYFSDRTDLLDVKMRLEDIGNLVIFKDFDPNTSQSYFASARLSRSLISLESFLNNPLVGGGKSGGHSTWLDILALYGIIGILPWLFIFRQQIKLNMKLFNAEFFNFYYYSIISCLIIGILTTGADFHQSTISIFVLVPGLYFIKNIPSGEYIKKLFSENNSL